MSAAPDILIGGAGIFGITSALELRRRGYSVTLLDQGPVPHPLAASKDISKVVRMEYGEDELYMEMAEQAMNGFDEWNQTLSRPFYHETGVAMLAMDDMQPGGFEYDSWQTLWKRGHQPERLRSEEIARRFPAWKTGRFTDGFFHRRGGWVESGALVGELIEVCRREGVMIKNDGAASLSVEAGRATGLRTADGRIMHASQILLACGAWIGTLLPEMDAVIRSTGHPVFHLRPTNPDLFSSPEFVTFTADIARTGWYGFPLHPSGKVVKIGRHSDGLPTDPIKGERSIPASIETELRTFLRSVLPELADAPVVYTRLCLYADSIDGDYWIDHHPKIEGLTVAVGGSGHGFKMAPILGALIADRIDGSNNPWLSRFVWRTPSAPKSEAARCSD